jgi:hypothetical protein
VSEGSPRLRFLLSRKRERRLGVRVGRLDVRVVNDAE